VVELEFVRVGPLVNVNIDVAISFTLFERKIIGRVRSSGRALTPDRSPVFTWHSDFDLLIPEVETSILQHKSLLSINEGGNEDAMCKAVFLAFTKAIFTFS
jgi:hypothetical protein